MRRVLFAMLLAAAGLLARLHRQNLALREEAERLAANYRAMTDTVIARRTASGRSVMAVQTLSLTPDELTAPLMASRLTPVADLGVKTKRINELTTVGTTTRVEAELTAAGEAEATATPPLSNEFGRRLEYHDPWVDIAVTEAQAALTIRDTLTLVEHRIPRRFWFIKFGTKCIRREVVAACPYTEVVTAEKIVVN